LPPVSPPVAVSLQLPPVTGGDGADATSGPQEGPASPRPGPENRRAPRFGRDRDRPGRDRIADMLVGDRSSASADPLPRPPSSLFPA